MNSPDQSNVHILSAEQGRRLLETYQRVAATGMPRKVLRELAARISDIVAVKVAFLAKVDETWQILAESHPEPSLPISGAASSKMFDRCNAALEHGVQTWSDDRRDWTLVRLAREGRPPAVLALEGDWTLSASAMLNLAQKMQFAEPASVMSLSAHVGVATHRLTRKLADVTGVDEVCAVILSHVVRAVPSHVAAIAVPAENNLLTIVATHGYPVELVEGIRIAPGSGIIGHVYQNRAPLCVPDVTMFPGLHRRRARYRTNSFIALPISAGSTVLGVVCAADRLDSRAFTRQDMSTLRALTAPAVLALARERAERQAAAFALAAVIDPVSGLYNRRYFQSRLEEELQRAQRHKTPVGLLMIDIDDFKDINDRFGHMAGDTVIKDVAEILRRSVRKFDLCTRFGGEEFAIVMPGSGPDNSASVAERIRQRIEEYEPDEPELKGLHVTASIGLSVSHDISPRELIGRADEAMYMAKRSGKNRVIKSPHTL